MPTLRTALTTALLAAWGAGCAEAPPEPRPEGAGTPELRAALFDTILARTERREAFSPVKNERLGLDPLAAMRALRDEVVAADTEAELFYALVRVNAARRDRHLDVYLVPGGLAPPDSAGLEVWDGSAPEPRRAPVRVFPDYTAGEAAFFVGDVATGSAATVLPEIGARVVSVAGMPVDVWAAHAGAHIPHSSEAGLRWKVAEAMGTTTALLVPELRPEPLVLETVPADAARGAEPVAYTLPYADESSLTWTGTGAPAYPGLSLARSTPTWDLWLPDDGRAFLVLVWHGFRETLVADVDTLVALAARDGLLGHAVVVDVTRSRGGSLGAYALQRLQPRPFRTTFGNLRLSDVTLPFVEEKRAEFEARAVHDGSGPETIDDGTWLMAWLEEDVLAALERGDAYSGDVPFKLAHAPKDSDGVLQPAPVHFRGRFAVVSGPHGGSHLDQFVSIVVDNDLGPVVGMPAGGYSNTWEWEETLDFPGTDQPVVGFMWNIGHTIRPNGEILEGNPAAVDESIPLGPHNVRTYYATLLERALARIGVAGGG